MTHASYLPPVPAPPHDPYHWRLDARVGWRAAVSKGVEMASGALALSPVEAVERRLNEPFGSFGGLVAPDHVAVSGAGDIHLLDKERARVLRFDPCRCEFDPVPCVGGVGAEPREFDGPSAIATRGDDLFVVDTGNGRVAVYMLRGWALRAHWAPPTSAELSQPWRPVDIAFDGSCRAYVADQANGVIHVFDPGGRWERKMTGAGGVRHIAIDGQGRLYLATHGSEPVRVLSPRGRVLELIGRRDVMAGRFPRLPFRVTPHGYIDLAAQCTKATGKAWPSGAFFAADGRRIEGRVRGFGTRYVKKGRYLSVALDSSRDQCQWDRIVLRLLLPEGTRVRVASWTSNVEQPIDLVEALPPTAWQVSPAAEATEEAEDGAKRRRAKRGGAEVRTWDALLTCPPGRFLWLAMELEGGGGVTPKVLDAKVYFPRISLARYLPAVYRSEPLSADFTDRFLAIFDRGFREIEAHVDAQARWLDVRSAPTGDRHGESDFLSWLAGWIGVVLSKQWPEQRKRRYLAEAGKLFCMRGTRMGLQRQLLLFLGVAPKRLTPSTGACAPCGSPAPPDWEPPPLVLEHFQLRRWLFVGTGRLGEQARLWGHQIVNRSQLDRGAQLGRSQLESSQDPYRDPFHVHAHRCTIFLPAALARDASQKKAAMQLVEQERPAHVQHDIRWVEPRFRVGIQSMIGYDSVIGCYPQGVSLDGRPLGRATVLPRAPSTGDTMAVGKDSRIGTTTKLG